ncbi:MAG TPA: hypothetical protein VMU62_04990, partial [Acidobacteriaceae bacterium]|nr:hypothetical protein [Acidobacteriaceae bacterium]
EEEVTISMTSDDDDQLDLDDDIEPHITERPLPAAPASVPTASVKKVAATPAPAKPVKKASNPAAKKAVKKAPAKKAAKKSVKKATKK